MTIRQSVEDGIIANLRALFHTEDGGYLKRLSPYHGPTTPERENEQFQRLTQGVMPCAVVTTGAGSYEDRTMGGRVADLTLQVFILVGSCNLRSGENRHRGDDGLSSDPGIYQIIEDIRDRLYNRPLAGAVGACRIRPIDEGPVLQANDRTIWLLEYEARTDVLEEALDANDPALAGISNRLGFSQVEIPSSPDDVTEFDT